MQQLSELWIKYRVQVLMIVIAAVVGGCWILNHNHPSNGWFAHRL